MSQQNFIHVTVGEVKRKRERGKREKSNTLLLLPLLLLLLLLSQLMVISHSKQVCFDEASGLCIQSGGRGSQPGKEKQLLRVRKKSKYVTRDIERVTALAFNLLLLVGKCNITQPHIDCYLWKKAKEPEINVSFEVCFT